MPLTEKLAERAPEPVHRYARGLALSVMHNVPAYGFSVVIGATALMATADLRHVTSLAAFLFLLGAASAFALVGALAAVAFEEEKLERALPKTLYIGAVFSVLSTSAGFGIALVVVHELQGLAAWFLAAFGATAAYVLVLALELDLASSLRRS